MGNQVLEVGKHRLEWSAIRNKGRDRWHSRRGPPMADDLSGTCWPMLSVSEVIAARGRERARERLKIGHIFAGQNWLFPRREHRF